MWEKAWRGLTGMRWCSLTTTDSSFSTWLCRIAIFSLVLDPGGGGHGSGDCAVQSSARPRGDCSMGGSCHAAVSEGSGEGRAKGPPAALRTQRYAAHVPLLACDLRLA